MTFDYLINNSVVLSVYVLVNAVGVIHSDHGTVCGNFNNVKPVNFTELHFLGKSSTRHTRKLGIHSEIVLEGDRSKCLVFFFYLYVFLSFNSLVKTV